jgi:deoxyribose-phosphate aldolase
MAHSIDQVGANERAADLAKRSIKKAYKLELLNFATSSIDLTTLEGSDTPGRVMTLCKKGIRPNPADPDVPSVAAICVYPAQVATAVGCLKGTRIGIASVATGFPSGQTSLKIKIEEIMQAIEDGATEIDIVINRGAFLSGNYGRVYEEIALAKKACGMARLKTILEVGELGSYDQVRKASVLAMAAGSDFIKTSTGKIQPAATLPFALIMMQAIADFYDYTGQRIGFKAAGGIKTSKQALAYIVIASEVLGKEWISPSMFRIGASTLLNDLLMQIAKEKTGNYQGEDYFTKD